MAVRDTEMVRIPVTPDHAKSPTDRHPSDGPVGPANTWTSQYTAESLDDAVQAPASGGASSLNSRPSLQFFQCHSYRIDLIESTLRLGDESI